MARKSGYETLHLLRQANEGAFQVGYTYLFRGLAGIYAVTVHRIVKVDLMDNNSRQYTVRASRRLVENPAEL